MNRKKYLKNGSVTFPFSPQKKLGQNFLFSGFYLQKIVACCPLNTNTVIVEIGSGYGTLTNLLAASPCQKLVGLEKDEQLFQWLITNNPKPTKITYLHQDVLQINWPAFCSEYTNHSLIVVGNLPYYIANSLIINLLINYQLFNSLIFLVQKEVGQRWVASPQQYLQHYSSLSVFLNFLAETSLVFNIPGSVFTPPSAVDGALVVLKIRSQVTTEKTKLLDFFRFVQNCFRFRRKTLRNNLLSFAGHWQLEWEHYFQQHHYSPNLRPQNLSPSEYWELFSYWEEKKAPSTK